MKRYAIVRVEMRCPYGLEETFCPNDCHQCRLGYGYYGVTKEQLIKKVAQAINKARIHECKTFVEATNKIAKEIVEFLGVEE